MENKRKERKRNEKIKVGRIKKNTIEEIRK